MSGPRGWADPYPGHSARPPPDQEEAAAANAPGRRTLRLRARGPAPSVAPARPSPPAPGAPRPSHIPPAPARAREDAQLVTPDPTTGAPKEPEVSGRAEF